MTCRNCRKKKHNLDSCPKPQRGSIRKKKRDEMRRQKKLRMQKAKVRSVQFSSGNTICQSVMSII